jgi:GT2 family glycosyltransferase
VKRYSVLCSGVEKWWKGTDTIRAACARLGVPFEGYEAKDLSQAALGREYDAAEVFVVGSTFEGFCQPGLEALACGVPLVTTDNGGCREYAIDGETALVVEPGDTDAMAVAIERLLDDAVLAKQLSENGLDMVARDFDWEARTDELVDRLDGVVAGRVSAPPPPRPAPPASPELSVVVLAWDNLLLTQRFVESVRRHTDVGYELVVVDNGSEADAAEYAAACGDTVVLNDTNLGFAVGMNQGLEVSTGEWIAFCNNDTVMPPGWASTLLETARQHPNAGIVVPAITAANNPVTVRTEPGNDVEVLPPFSAPPAAVIYLARADVIRQLGAWGTEYEVASGEDVDLAFKVWVNDLDIVYDQRVLVEHISKGTASRLDDWQDLWARNRRRFLDKWSGTDLIPRLESCPPDRHARNRQTAAAVAGWMDRYFTIRDRANAAPSAGSPATLVDRGLRRGRMVWRKVQHRVPPQVARKMRHTLRTITRGR